MGVQGQEQGGGGRGSKEVRGAEVSVGVCGGEDGRSCGWERREGQRERQGKMSGEMCAR